MTEKKIIWIACAYEIQCSKKHRLTKGGVVAPPIKATSPHK